MKAITKAGVKCVALFTLLLIVSLAANAQLRADFTATPLSGCPPMVVNFQDQSTGSPTTWHWDLGNGTISFLQNPIATYFDPGTYTVKLVVRTATGVDSVVKNQFITVYALPEPRFGVSDSTGCFPLTVNFRDSSLSGSGTITSWQWDFGDGTLSTLQHPSHTYTNAGNFTVTLRIVNSNGCSKVISKFAYIKLLSGVVADYSFAVTPSCTAPTRVTFTNNSTGTGVINYLWNFGDGQTSAQANPVHNYTTAGTYTISLIVRNASGCADTLVKPNAITISYVKANFNRPDTVCAGTSFTPVNTSTPTATGASWSFGDGTTSAINNPVKSYSTPGTYQIKMVNDFGLCKDSIVRSIVVLPKPTAVFTGVNTASCKVPLTVPFANASIGGSTYMWDFGDGQTSTLTNPVHTYTAFGNFIVKLIVRNANGCSDTLVKNNFVSIVRPTISGISGVPFKGCVPYTLTPVPVIQTSETITSYQWDFGDGTTSTLPNPSHTYTTAGAYSINLIITTASGCKDSIFIWQGIKVGNKPNAQFFANPTDVCANTGVLFTDQSNGGVIDEWFWTFGDGATSTLQNPLHPYTDTGKFTVELVVYSMGCSDTIKRINYIHVRPPIASFDTSFTCGDPLRRNFIDKSIGATSWEWDFGDGNTSTISSPSHVFAASGTYQVKLKVSNGLCTHTTLRPVLVIKENGKLTVSDSVGCRNVRVVFDVQNYNPVYVQQYTWFFEGFSGPSIITSNNPVASRLTVAGNYPSAVIVKNKLQCVDTFSVNLPIRIYGPKANFNVAPSTCFGNATVFNDSTVTDGINSITNYTWNFGEGTTRTFTNPPFTHVYDTTGTFGVSLLVVDAYGCRDSITKPSVITITDPIAAFTISDTSICPSAPIVFTNISSGTNITYDWDFGDGTTANTVSPSHSYTVDGTYTARLIIRDQYGCSDTATKIIKAYKSVADFAMSDSFSSCPPLFVNFTNNSRGYVDLAWDFGDGGTSTLQNPAHIYIYPGTFNVKLWVRNNGGCSDTLVRPVIIQGPFGSFRYNPLTLCAPGHVDFVATTQNAISYIWDFNDGNTIFSSQTSIAHDYGVPGSYIPKIILEDASGCRVPIVGTDTIRIKDVQTNILAQSRVLCDSGLVAFRDSTWSNDVINSFRWNFGDGNTSTSRTPTHNYARSGLYTVTLITTTQAGCTDTAVYNDYIKIVNSPVVSILGDTAACEPALLTFQGNVLRPDTAAVTWRWNFGNAQNSTQQNPVTQTYATAGTYPVSLIVTNSIGCADTVGTTALIHPKPIINAGADTTVCRFNDYVLQATGGARYQWDAHPTLSCTNCPNPTARPVANISYAVTGFSTFGCSNRDTLSIIVKQPFTITVGNGDTLCVGESFRLNASGAERFTWSPALWLDNPNIASPRSTPDSTITYQVIGRDSSACFQDTGYIRLKVYPIPTIDITNGSPITLQVGSNVKLLTNSSPDVNRWRWTPAQWLSCASCPEPQASPKQTTTYSVVASNDGKCIARDEITVNVVCNNGNIFVPNTFSPNGDGNNDQFFPRGKGVYAIKNFRVFNRWGQVVFEKSNISANNASDGWDGTFNGIKSYPDVYVYILDVVCENNIIFPIKGNITLLR